MIIDAENEFSDDQAVTASGKGTNVFDAKVTEDIGNGEPVTVEFLITTAVTMTGSGTVTFQLVDDDNAAHSSPAVLVASAAIPKADLVAGYKVRLTLPAGAQNQRYFGVYYSNSENWLTGNVKAYISPVAQAANTYVGV